MLKVEWKHLNKQINIWLVMAVYLLGTAISLKMGGTYIDSHLITRAEYYTSFFETFEGKYIVPVISFAFISKSFPTNCQYNSA